jgi:hypothetical protein
MDYEKEKQILRKFIEEKFQDDELDFVKQFSVFEYDKKEKSWYFNCTLNSANDEGIYKINQYWNQSKRKYKESIVRGKDETIVQLKSWRFSHTCVRSMQV